MKCFKCKQERTPDEFYKNKDGSFRRPCLHCAKQRWQANNQKNREANRQRYLREKEARLEKQFKLAYGISLKDYDELLKVQNNRCALCDKPFIRSKKRPHLDHDHKTGKIRGVLHGQCNTLLGFANDDVEILQKAINYLQL